MLFGNLLRKFVNFGGEIQLGHWFNRQDIKSQPRTTNAKP
jgi:hypothetical protein